MKVPELANQSAQFFLSNAYVSAFGRNVVNVILVDFRALRYLWRSCGRRNRSSRNGIAASRAIGRQSAVDNVIIRKTLAFIWRVVLLYSIYIMLRGHNEPAAAASLAGSLAAIALILKSYTKPKKSLAESRLKDFPQYLGYGLLLFLACILFPLVFGKSILQGLWTSVWLPIAGKFSSILIFDIIVYSIVAASAVYAHAVLLHDPKQGSRQ